MSSYKTDFSSCGIMPSILNCNACALVIYVRIVLIGFKKILVALNHCEPGWAEVVCKLLIA